MAVTSQSQDNWRFQPTADNTAIATASCTFSSPIDKLDRPFVLQLNVSSSHTGFEGSGELRDFISLADASIIGGSSDGGDALRDAKRDLTITAEGGWWEVAITTEKPPLLEMRLTATPEVVEIARRAYVSTACVQRTDTACPTSIPGESAWIYTVQSSSFQPY
jgi:hypothetical protein